MKVKRTFDTDNYGGACVVLTNYLDGALADLEAGTTEAFDIIEDCINALELMSISFFGVGVYEEYREKFEEIKKNQKEVV